MGITPVVKKMILEGKAFYSISDTAKMLGANSTKVREERRQHKQRHGNQNGHEHGKNRNRHGDSKPDYLFPRSHREGLGCVDGFDQDESADECEE
jgi:hypothetical protein